MQQKEKEELKQAALNEIEENKRIKELEEQKREKEIIEKEKEVFLTFITYLFDERLVCAVNLQN